ncbi:MAG: hypothetical protein HYZ75_15725 [Elusimicrobia bacterium]|nr:hypothetical protein [Elusimicrobiota bacterium]
MPLALTARIRIRPEPLLKDKRVHDIAHAFLAARIRAMKALGIPVKMMPGLG